MKIRTEKFCNLATSPSWQSWLYHFDEKLYSEFIQDMRKSKGCSSNNRIMLDVLDKVSSLGGAEKLYDFLGKNYPQMIVNNFRTNTQNRHESLNSDDVFSSYTPDIVTYPRRIIFSGEARELRKRVNEFLLDKIAHDKLFLGDKAYVEYLTKSDSYLKDSIPLKNWQIAAYRNKNNL